MTAATPLLVCGFGPYFMAQFAIPPALGLLAVAWRWQLNRGKGVTPIGLARPVDWLLVVAFPLLMFSTTHGFFPLIAPAFVLVWIISAGEPLTSAGKKVGATSLNFFYPVAISLVAVSGIGMWFQNGEEHRLCVRSKYTAEVRQRHAAFNVHAALEVLFLSDWAEEERMAKAGSMWNGRWAAGMEAFYRLEPCAADSLPEACIVAVPLRPDLGSVRYAPVNATADPYIWAQGDWAGLGCSLVWPPTKIMACPPADLWTAESWRGSPPPSFTDLFPEFALEPPGSPSPEAPEDPQEATP